MSSQSLRQRRSFSQRPPCVEHGLATGPDGLCTLCKRSQSSRPVGAPEVSERGALAQLVTALLGLLALASFGVALSVAFGLIDAETLLPSALRESSAPSVRAPVPPPPQPKIEAVAIEPKSQAALAAERAAQQIADQAKDLAAAAAASGLSEADKARRLAEESEQDRKRHEMIESDIAERAKKRARGGVSVVMYSTSWCPSCVAAREYMTANAIPFTDHDIEKSPSARAIQRRLNPKGSIPTIDVEGAVLVGFSGESLEEMIEVAAKKRLR